MKRKRLVGLEQQMGERLVLMSVRDGSKDAKGSDNLGFCSAFARDCFHDRRHPSAKLFSLAWLLR